MTNTNLDIPVQQMSMQLISIPRAIKYTKIAKNRQGSHPLDDLISRVVSTYNETHKKVADAAKKTENKRAKINCVSNCFEPRNYNDKMALGYEMKPYARVAKYDTNLAATLKSTGAEQLPPHTKSEFLLFFYRSQPQREIVSLTTGMAWNAVRSVSDVRAPLQIAEKILNPRQIVEIARICLVGSNVKETLYNPAENELYKTTKLYYLVESFQCKIKEKSSFMQLENNKKKLFEEPPILKVTTAGLLRLQKKVNLPSYAFILDLFSKYVRGEKTFVEKDVEEVSAPGFEFLHFVKEAPFRMKDALNSKLLEIAFAFYQEGVEPTIYFRHKFLRDYLEASSYWIVSENSSAQQFPSETPRSLSEMINLLNPKDLNDLNKLFCSTKLAFLTKEGTSIVALLVDCLEGEVRTEEGDSYFKVRGMWYKIEADYLALLQQDFRSLVCRTLIKKESEGQLPLPWQGNKRQGVITEQLLKTRLDIQDGVRVFLQSLKKAKVCYVEKESCVVHQKVLLGEILNNKTIASNKDQIEALVLKSNKAPNLNDLKKIFKESDAKIIFEELIRQRFVLNEKNYVLNPFPYSFKKDRCIKGKYESFVALLKEQSEAYAAGSEDEKGYNRSYLAHELNIPGHGYLVFDQILSDNVELCDLLYYSENNTFLYHIKETFGQDTRVACSQILNAATSLRSALSTHQSQSYLDRLWDEATKESEQDWLRLMRQQLERLGRNNFLKIFQERKVVFVYAFLENPNRSIHAEASLPALLSQELLGISKEMFEALQKQGFLDAQGRLTGKFLGWSQKRFVLEGFLEESRDLFTKLSQYKTFSSSTLAKHDLLHLAQQLAELGFSLEICEISRADAASSRENASQAPTQIESDALLFKPTHVEESGSEIDSDDELLVPRFNAGAPNGKYEKDSDDDLLIAADNLIASDVKHETDSDDELLVPINKKASSSKPLSPGDTFSLNRSRYRIEKTLGEGACALHALLGERIAGVFRFKAEESRSSDLAKKHFTKALAESLKNKNEEIENVFIDILTCYLDAALKGKDPSARQLFSEHGTGKHFLEKWKDLKMRYEAELATHKKSEADDWATHVLKEGSSLLSLIMNRVQNDQKGRFKGKKQNEMIELFKENSQNVLDIIATNRDEFESLLEDQVQIKYHLHLQEETTNKWRSEKRNLILSQKMISHYISVVETKDFQLNTQEILLAANLFEKSVRIITSRNGEITLAEERIGGSGTEPIVIHHRGQHFERCERLDSRREPEKADLKEE